MPLIPASPSALITYVRRQGRTMACSTARITAQHSTGISGVCKHVPITCNTQTRCAS